MSDYPTCRHQFCQVQRCPVCLDDAISLERFFTKRLGRFLDWLGKYRAFMDITLGRSSETEWGWFDPIIFEPEYIEAFIKDWRGE